MRRSLDDIVESSQRMLEGEAIIGLDPDLVDQSPVMDRVQNDDEEYAALRDLIAASGQATPVLVRPHPEKSGRYVIVFGRRRLKAAQELGRLVRAVVKSMDEQTAIVAQGQENAARSNLSFIERSRFARELIGLQHSKETVKAALAVDDTLLSRMLSVADVIPNPVLEALGAAKGVGRDRWEELKKLLLMPANAEKAIAFVADRTFVEAAPGERFGLVLAFLKAQRKRRAKGKNSEPSTWSPADQSVKVTAKGSGKSFTLALTAEDGPQLGAWILENLESIYRDFRQSEQTED